MLFNNQGSYAARPDSFTGGLPAFRNNYLQLYGAGPLVAESLAALQGKRLYEVCNFPTSQSNDACNGKNVEKGLSGDVSAEQLQTQWAQPYAIAGNTLPQGCEKGN
jgi:hypothetical protein